MTVDYKIEFENERAKFQAETLVTSRLYQEIAELRSKPATLDAEVVEIVCRRLHSQAYCNENVDDEWTDFIDDAKEILQDIRAASAVQAVTVEEFEKELSQSDHTKMSYFIEEKFPNGLKLVKEKK